MIAGSVFDIQRFSLHDGPGIRTTVFLKGCPLRCNWCHNPEGWERAPQLRLAVNSCTRCGHCSNMCLNDAHQVTPTEHRFYLDRCIRCGRCIDACPVLALEWVGKQMDVDAVMAVVRRDQPFYHTSGGGMTLSGGEPLAQTHFALALLQAAHSEGISTAIETTACASWEILTLIQPYVDLFLVDIKHINPERHRELTGIDNVLILDNITHMIEEGWPIILRIPWVPSQNAEQGFLDGLISFLSAFATPPEVNFLLYHRLDRSKWQGLGGDSPMPDVAAALEEEVAPWISRLAEIGVDATVSK